MAMSSALGSVPLLASPAVVEPSLVAKETPSWARPDVDWQLVVKLRRTAAEQIADAAEREQVHDAVDRRLLGRAIIRRVVRDHAEDDLTRGSTQWSRDIEADYATAVENAVFGYGRWQPLFEIPDAENIEIHGWDEVWIQYPDGRRVSHPPVADSDEELVEAVRFLASLAVPSRPFDDAHPTMTLALGDRFRLHAIGFGLSYRPSITIRQHTMTDVTLAELSAGGMMPTQVAEFLAAVVLAGQSIVISGDQGAGKTTLLRALIAEIPAHERFGTLETDYELLTHLQPDRRHVVALQARMGMGEVQDGRRLGEVTVADLMPEALRQNLSRLVVGEVRGQEARTMLEVAMAGVGLMSTTHSHSAVSTIDRLAARVSQGGDVTISEAKQQIAHHIDVLVHVQLRDDTWRGGARTRRISEIHQLTGAVENGQPITHRAYAADEGALCPEPSSMTTLAPVLHALRERS